MDSVSHNLGILIGNNIQSQGFEDINIDKFTEGLELAYSGKQVDLQKAQGVINQHMTAKTQEMKGSAMEVEKNFLAENIKRDGVQATDSGLQYEVIKKGDGVKPSAESTVTVHYEGKLLDGKVFDSSIKRGEPATFPVNGVIQGWQEALQLMPVGSRYLLFIPQHLAYGERGAGQDIPPYATLIFDVELLEIK